VIENGLGCLPPISVGGMKNRCLIICPVYNEADYLVNFHRDLRRHYGGKIVFVDDGSTDGSRELIRSLDDTGILTILHTIRRGYGSALKTGFRFALNGGWEKVVTIDADLQHPPRLVPEFLQRLEKREVILGSRYLEGDPTGDAPPERRLINRYVSSLLEKVFDTKFTDPFCGLRAYRCSFLEKAILNENSYGLGLEILLELIRTQTEFEEVPLEAIYLDYSRTFLDGLQTPRERLWYYLKVIERKKREIDGEDTMPGG